MGIERFLMGSQPAPVGGDMEQASAVQAANILVPGGLKAMEAEH
jgi:hypothetical protein